MPRTVTSQLVEAGVPLDEEGRAHGYSLTKTRAYGISQWLERKEDKEYAALFNRLNVRRWRMALKAEGGARWRAFLDYHKHWGRAKRAKLRPARLEAARAMVKTCPTCNVEFTPIPLRPGNPPRFCCAECMEAWPAIKREREAKNKVRSCAECGVEYVTIPGTRPRPQVYCGPECRRLNYNRRRRKRRSK
jgi:hypothetical protein